jgi:hypothetical protein
MKNELLVRQKHIKKNKHPVFQSISSTSSFDKNPKAILNTA